MACGRGKVIVCLFWIVLLFVACASSEESVLPPSGESTFSSTTEPGREESVSNSTMEVGREESASNSTIESDQETEDIQNIEKYESTEQISVVNLCSNDSYVMGRIIDFDKEYPQYQISYEKEDMNKDAVMIELMSGSGPDILCISRDDLDNLQANGALGDMNSILSQDTLAALLPTAVAMGTYEDKLLGLPTSVYVRTLVTSRQYWQNDTWSVEDVLSILREHEEIGGMFATLFGQDQYDYNLWFLIGMDILNTPFIENGESRFNVPEFKELLSIVKEKTNNIDRWRYTNTPLYECVGISLYNGDYLAVESTIGSIAEFGRYVCELGEDFLSIGYPSDTGSCGYMQCSEYGMVVVNQASIGKPGVKELVEYLFSLDAQKYVRIGNISIRRDIPEDRITYSDYNETYVWKDSFSESSVMLPRPEDGSFYLDDYLEFLDKTEPLPLHSEEIFNIIMEEADYYFLSGKELDEVVNTIDRRVKLYLSEQG